MARSYKKNPIIKDNSRWAIETRKNSIRKLRKLDVFEHLPNGNHWKKNVNGYDVCDYIYYSTYKDYAKRERDMDDWCATRGYKNTPKSEKELYRDWYTSYKRK